MPEAEFDMTISSLELKKYYQGKAQNILVKATNGLRIKFPANLLLPYVGHSGVSGKFILSYDRNGKFRDDPVVVK